MKQRNFFGKMVFDPPSLLLALAIMVLFYFSQNSNRFSFPLFTMSQLREPLGEKHNDKRLTDEQKLKLPLVDTDKRQTINSKL